MPAQFQLGPRGRLLFFNQRHEAFVMIRINDAVIELIGFDVVTKQGLERLLALLDKRLNQSFGAQNVIRGNTNLE